MARITSFIPRRRRRRASIAANAGRRARRAGVVRRDTGVATTWTKRAAVLGVISASLSLGTAILHWLPASPSPTTVVVIYAPSQPGGGTGETPPNGTSGRGDHPADDRDGCARLGKASPWPSPSWRPPTRRGEAARGNEGAVMAVAGWTRRHMIDRYAAPTVGARAADESREVVAGRELAVPHQRSSCVGRPGRMAPAGHRTCRS